MYQRHGCRVVVSHLIFILFHQIVVAKKYRHIHTEIHTHRYKYTNIHIIYAYMNTYVEATELYDMADTLFH